MQVRDYLGFYDLLAFEILYPLSPRAPNLPKPPSPYDGQASCRGFM